MYIRPYQKLLAWKEAHALCLWLYRLTATFPSAERYRLTDQLCRASASVPTNITEGARKGSAKERAHYFEIALCSLEEAHYHCLLARDLGYITLPTFEEADERIRKASFLLSRLHQAILK